MPSLTPLQFFSALVVPRQVTNNSDDDPVGFVNDDGFVIPFFATRVSYASCPSAAI
jgi:hypothetical protein